MWIYGQLLQRCVTLEDVCGLPIQRGKLGLSARLTILEEHLNKHKGLSARRRPVSRAAEQPLPPTREAQRQRWRQDCAYSFILGRNILLPSLVL